MFPRRTGLSLVWPADGSPWNVARRRAAATVTFVECLIQACKCGVNVYDAERYGKGGRKVDMWVRLYHHRFHCCSPRCRCCVCACIIFSLVAWRIRNELFCCHAWVFGGAFASIRYSVNEVNIDWRVQPSRIRLLLLNDINWNFRDKNLPIYDYQSGR